jgi:signal transduction histidine kinase
MAAGLGGTLYERLGLSAAERASRLIRLAAIVGVACFTLFAGGGPGLHGRSLAYSVVAAVLVITAALMLAAWLRTGAIPPGLLVFAAPASGILVGVGLSAPTVCYPFLLAGYSAAALPRRWAAIIVGLVAVSMTASVLAVGEPITALWLNVILALVVLGGLVRYARREQQLQLQRALAEAERARVAEAGEARLTERARIARDLHDVLAHSIAALGLKLDAAGALLDAGQIDRARAEVSSARQLARDGMTETRRALAALGPGEVALPDLLAGLTTSGADVALRIEGAGRCLPEDVTEALYRVAQEGVTNARKHAPGSTIDLRLDYEDSRVVLTVDNGSARTNPSADARGLSAGLVGMCSRIEALGGTFVAGPTSAGGWQVRALLSA